MNYKQLTGTDLLVSGLCLGTVQFGASVGEKECFEQLDEFTDLGGNFLDTAHVYGDWLPGERARSERVIGKWLKQSGKRNHYVISTKGANPRLESMDVPRVNRRAIMTDMEERLKCLDTDTIDLYFLHRDDEKVSVCNQLMWSLADINPSGLGDPTLVWMDRKSYAYHEEKQISAMAYMSAAKGYFSKLLRGDLIPEKVAAIYENEANGRIAGELKALLECEITPMQTCISYFNGQPFTAIPLASFRSIEQMREAAAGCDMLLDKEIREKIDKIKVSASDI